MTFYIQHGKRFLDVALALILICALSWLVLLIVLVYLILGESPVLFVDQRIGRGDKLFRLFKFRTLKMQSQLTLPERRFGWGSFLRRTNLDEIPQLINILSGEMSFIGPRPLPAEYLPLYSDEQRRRHHVRPGITGWAQINGRHSISWAQKFVYDIYYVDHMSFALDCRIVIKTIVLLLAFKKDTSLYEQKFTGNENA